MRNPDGGIDFGKARTIVFIAAGKPPCLPLCCSFLNLRHAGLREDQAMMLLNKYDRYKNYAIGYISIGFAFFCLWAWPTGGRFRVAMEPEKQPIQAFTRHRRAKNCLIAVIRQQAVHRISNRLDGGAVLDGAIVFRSLRSKNQNQESWWRRRAVDARPQPGSPKLGSCLARSAERVVIYPAANPSHRRHGAVEADGNPVGGDCGLSGLLACDEDAGAGLQIGFRC